MNVFFWIVVLPILDLYFLFRMITRLGGWPMGLWLGTTALLGILLIRVQVPRLPRSRRSPGMLGRALNVFAGLLLVFPGPLSDLLALALLFPPTRYLVRERIQSSMKISSPTGWMWRFGGFDGHEEHGPHGDDRSDPRGSSSPEKEGDGRGEFPGADRARDVDFQPSDPDSQNSRPGS